MQAELDPTLQMVLDTTLTFPSSYTGNHATKPKLLDQVRNIIRLKRYSIHTERVYVNRIKHFILFHHKRHPNEMGALEVQAFLTHLAVNQNVAASTQ
jgi:hypothetical protein